MKKDATSLLMVAEEREKDGVRGESGRQLVRMVRLTTTRLGLLGTARKACHQLHLPARHIHHLLQECARG